MEQGKIFRTKTGFCHVLPDKIELTRDGIRGHAAKLLMGNNIGRVLMVYALLSMALFYFAYNDFGNESYVTSVLYLLLGAYFVLGIATGLNNSGTPTINRDKIVRINFTKGISGLTRSRFEVYFRNEKGRTKKRIIMMPGSLNGEKEENEKALQIMREEKLMP